MNNAARNEVNRIEDSETQADDLARLVLTDRDAMLAMAEAMRTRGGGFVQALAECFVRADHANLRKLVKAFPAYVAQYMQVAKWMAAEAERQLHHK
jgi:hypothetical protein